MAKKKSNRDQLTTGKRDGKPTANAEDVAGGQHHAASAHGIPAKVDASLPATRAELLALHADARRRRAAAPLGSEAFQAAVDEIARIEVRVASIEQPQDAPRG